MPSYTVKAGDSYASISGRFFGNQRWMQALSEANSNASLHPGMTINIPNFDTQADPLVTNEFVERSNLQQQEYDIANQMAGRDPFGRYMDYYVPGLQGAPPTLSPVSPFSGGGGEVLGIDQSREYVQNLLAGGPAAPDFTRGMGQEELMATGAFGPPREDRYAPSGTPAQQALQPQDPALGGVQTLRDQVAAQPDAEPSEVEPRNLYQTEGSLARYLGDNIPTTGAMAQVLGTTPDPDVNIFGQEVQPLPEWIIELFAGTELDVSGYTGEQIMAAGLSPLLMAGGEGAMNGEGLRTLVSQPGSPVSYGQMMALMQSPAAAAQILGGDFEVGGGLGPPIPASYEDVRGFLGQDVSPAQIQAMLNPTATPGAANQEPPPSAEMNQPSFFSQVWNSLDWQGQLESQMLRAGLLPAQGDPAGVIPAPGLEDPSKLPLEVRPEVAFGTGVTPEQMNIYYDLRIDPATGNPKWYLREQGPGLTNSGFGDIGGASEDLYPDYNWEQYVKPGGGDSSGGNQPQRNVTRGWEYGQMQWRWP